MFDPKAPSSLRAIKELETPGMMHELHRTALLRAGHEEDAKDLAIDSIVRVLDPDDVPWLGVHTFLVHMFSVVRQTWYRQRRRRRHKSEIPDGGEAQENTANAGELPDVEVERKRSLEVHRTLGGRLFVRLADDPDALRLLGEMSSNDLELSEQAAALGVTVDKIRAIRKRILYQARIVRDEWEASEQRRMKALRERATNPREEGNP